MNFALHRHRKLTDVISVPKGLPELMSDLAKQVLKFQPENIEEFLANYLDALVQTRELIYIAETTVQDVLANSLEIEELMRKVDLSMPKATQVLEIIKDEFRMQLNKSQDSGFINELDIIKRLINECSLSVKQSKKIAEIIDHSWEFFYNQNKANSLSRQNMRNSIEIKKSQEEAAIKIQTWYRNLKNENLEREHFMELEKSAIIIQSKIRAFLNRKKVD